MEEHAFMEAMREVYGRGAPYIAWTMGTLMLAAVYLVVYIVVRAIEDFL